MLPRSNPLNVLCANMWSATWTPSFRTTNPQPPSKLPWRKCVESYPLRWKPNALHSSTRTDLPLLNFWLTTPLQRKYAMLWRCVPTELNRSLLVSSLISFFVCHNVTLFLQVQNTLTSLVDTVSLKSIECSLCKYIVSYIDNIIQNNKSEAAIEAALEKVCGILPESIKDKCTAFVDTYGPILAQLLAKYTTPDEVCKALKVCIKETLELKPGTSIDHPSTGCFIVMFSSRLASNRYRCDQVRWMFSLQVCGQLLGYCPRNQQIRSRHRSRSWESVRNPARFLETQLHRLRR